MRFQKIFIVLLFSSIANTACSSAVVAQDAQPAQLLESNSCLEGDSRQGFLTSITTGDLPCPQGVQTCVAGRWQGPELFQSCLSTTKSCGGQPHGSVVSGYLQPVAAPGSFCQPAMKSCVDGAWAGPEVFLSCSEM